MERAGLFLCRSLPDSPGTLPLRWILVIEERGSYWRFPTVLKIPMHLRFQFRLFRIAKYSKICYNMFTYPYLTLFMGHALGTPGGHPEIKDAAPSNRESPQDALIQQEIEAARKQMHERFRGPKTPGG